MGPAHWDTNWEVSVRWITAPHSTGRVARVRRHREAGMTTAEYAVGTVAACAFGAVLLAVVRSGTVRALLEAAITAALGAAS